jgi:hypothetical protein
MRRWFLSYNSQDLGLMQSLEGSLRRKDPEAHVYFAPKSVKAGTFWLPSLANEIAEATVFVLLVGEKGVGPWQVLEYNEALARRAKEPAFPLEPDDFVALEFDHQAKTVLAIRRRERVPSTTSKAAVSRCSK